MKRTVYTALFAAVVGLAAANAMADDVKKETVKPVHHKKHHAMMNHTYGWSEKEVQVLQQSLRDSGFYKGTVTGKWDASTENALASYQSANGLAVTGTLNDATVKQLGLHHAAKEKVASEGVPVSAPKHKMHHKVKPVHKEAPVEAKKDTKESH